MGLDFVTLVAQIINLAVLIWLLKRFLYRPIVNMIEQRQALIDAEIKKARAATKAAQNEEVLYQKKLNEFDAKRTQMLSDVKTQVDVFRDKLTKDAKDAIQMSKKNWQMELMQEKTSFDVNLQNAIVQNFKLFAADAIKDMAGIELTDLVIHKFKELVGKLNATARKKFYENVAVYKRITITSASKLEKQVRQDLQTFLINFFALEDIPKIKFEFKENPLLVCGVEVQVGEQMTSWNLQSYLEAFENNMDAAFNDLLHSES